MGWITDVMAWFADAANWQGEGGIPARLLQHVFLTVASLAIACSLSLPLALWLGHIGRGGTIAVNVTNIGRAIPTFAVLVLLAIGPIGSSRLTLATVLALVLFAIPPIVTNTYVGVRGVDRDAVESARGMGMSGLQILRKVELPLAAPLVVTGIHLAAVQVVATATIAALVGGGGLGRFITAGFATRDQAEIVAGALLVALLAIAVELSFEVLQRRMDPLRRARRDPEQVEAG